MRIALVVHDLLGQAGHGVYARVLADHFSRQDAVTVYANRWERPSDAKWDARQVRALRISATSSVATFPFGLKRWRSDLARSDIIHCQGFCGGAPNVVTAHYCAAAFRGAIESPSAINAVSLWTQEAIERSFYRTYRGRIIAVSRRVAADLREHYGVTQPITVIHHGVDASRYSPADHGAGKRLRAELRIAPERRVALYVGDLAKAHTRLRELAERCPKVVFVNVTRSLRYRWEAANVFFAPPTAAIEAFYALANVLLFPSVYDAFGMVVLEGMACGLPVISSDRAGASELITHGEDGYVFPLGQWVDRASSLLMAEDEFAAIGPRAAVTASQHRWERAVASVEQVYAQAIAAR
jgi:UDP-glucose:(heptosyl)LPS alpha-1,3-glucosyltransferase